jgi:hypothetical protein
LGGDEGYVGDDLRGWDEDCWMGWFTLVR